MDLEVVGRRPRREPHDQRLHGERDAGAGAQPGLEEALLVGDGGRQGGAGVAEPPEAVVERDDEEGAVQVGVVVDLEVTGAADGQAGLR